MEISAEKIAPRRVDEDLRGDIRGQRALHVRHCDDFGRSGSPLIERDSETLEPVRRTVWIRIILGVDLAAQALDHMFAILRCRAVFGVSVSAHLVVVDDRTLDRELDEARDRIRITALSRLGRLDELIATAWRG